ncbi:hypothetical protein [Streptomyces sp. NPDC059918]|uniref:hypothetical protein n=1 Tax=unclassified Streptomyces TaxID=2593676 RepID=UPI00364D2741
MRNFSRRELLGLGLGLGAAVTATACGAPTDGPNPPGSGPDASASAGGTAAPGKPIGDGSTSDTGPQPRQPATPTPLGPGEAPPQFVVLSWDGAGEIGATGLFARFLRLAREHGAAMTFFLSGIYLLPESRKELYRPPRNPVGASDIGYLKDENIRATLTRLREAWTDGHEIGTHFNGHFCAGSGSVARWSTRDWHDEIDQAMSFVTNWRTNTGFSDLEPLPFDYRKELVGGRTPCLLGQEDLLPAARERGWRYDASSPGGLQQWPAKKAGLWDLPLQSIPFPGRSFEVLSMDYNIMANQSKNSTRGAPASYPGWRTQATGAYLAGFRRAYENNRAPLFIGNHFEQWNGGIYMDAVENALTSMAGTKDVRLVSFRQLADWLDAQDPEVLGRLRRLSPGQKPPGGWAAYLGTG